MAMQRRKRTVKNARLSSPVFKNDHHIRQKVEHEHADQLSGAGQIPALLILHGEEPEIIICVNGDQKDYQISGYLHNKIRQCLTYSTPRLK